MSGKAEKDRAAHQAELGRSGYRLPEHFYVDHTERQPSSEKESGDGGASGGEEDQESEHGYKGKLQTPEEFQQEQARKNGFAPAENKRSGQLESLERSGAADNARRATEENDRENARQGAQGSTSDASNKPAAKTPKK